MPTLTRLAEALAEKERVQATLDQAGQGDIRLQDCINLTSRSAVFRAKRGAERLIAKHYFNGDPARTVKAAAAELERQAPRMSSGAFQVPRCILALPEVGLIVMSRVPGQQMKTALTRATPSTRRRLLSLAGEWLAHYGAETEEVREFAPRYWVTALQDERPAMLAPDKSAILEETLSLLWERAADLAGHPVTHSAVHGDFIPRNIHVHKGVLYGVDINGRIRRARVRELAAFAVTNQVQDPRDGADQRFGISPADLAPLVSKAGLAADELTTLLPFFIGERLVAHGFDNHLDPPYWAQVAGLCRQWCDDMRRDPVWAV